jgi:hypothetical protein
MKRSIAQTREGTNRKFQGKLLRQTDQKFSLCGAPRDTAEGETIYLTRIVRFGIVTVGVSRTD